LAEFGEDRIRVSVSALSVDTAEVIKADRLSIVRTPSIDKLFKSKHADLDKQKVTELSPGDSAVPDRPKTIGKLKTATRPPLNEGGDTDSLMQALGRASQLKKEIADLSEQIISKYEARKKI
jgi:hypothetical protein